MQYWQRSYTNHQKQTCLNTGFASVFISQPISVCIIISFESIMCQNRRYKQLCITISNNDLTIWHWNLYLYFEVSSSMNSIDMSGIKKIEYYVTDRFTSCRHDIIHYLHVFKHYNYTLLRNFYINTQSNF